MPTSSATPHPIPEPQPGEVGRIPESVATNPLIGEDADLVVTFSYKDYNTSECQLSNLSDKPAKQVMSRLREVSGKSLPEFKAEIETVDFSGEYKKIFRGLSPDVEMYEIKCGGSKRVFGHLTSHIFNITAIKTTHYDTDKVRR